MKDGIYEIDIHKIKTYYIVSKGEIYLSRKVKGKDSLVPTFIPEERLPKMKRLTDHNIIERLEKK